MASIKELAFLSSAIYDPTDWNGWEIKVYGYELKNGGIGNVKKEEGRQGNGGFRAALYTKGNERVIAFCGSVENIDWYRDNKSILFYQIPRQAEYAIAFFESIMGIESGNKWKEDIFNRKIDTPTSDITVTGHSLGGVLATFVGNKYALNTVTFNSPGTSGLITRRFDLDSNGNIVLTTEEMENCVAGYEVELSHSIDADRISNYVISSDIVGN